MNENDAVFLDTSAIVALLNTKDREHETAKHIISNLVEKSAVLVVTNFIIAEAYTVILKRIDYTTAIEFLEVFSKSVQIERILADDETHAIEILKQYNDKKFSYVDATSFAVMRRLSLKQAFAFDVHFEQFGAGVLTD